MGELKLDPDQIIRTLEQLVRRIRERFPEAVLGDTAEAVLATARAAARRTEEIQRPILSLRFAIGFLILLLPAALVGELIVLDLPMAVQSLGDFAAFFQASIESLVFLAVGILFLMSIETRVKRRRTLRAVHELRELAHIVDMHQLDKDPGYPQGARTKSSPTHAMPPRQMNRYLDYCSELLSLIGKVAALYGQRMEDPIAFEATLPISESSSEQ